MSLSLDTKYNSHLRQIIAEMDASPAEVANSPEPIFGGARVRTHVVPESLPYANPLHDVLEAEDQLSVDYMDGGNVLKDISKAAKKSVKSVKKAAKGIEKGAVKLSKSKGVKTAVKGVKTVGKAVGSAVLDEAEKLSGPAGAALGTSAAIALGQPELAGIGAALGAKIGKDLAGQARKSVKKTTGMGKPKGPSPYIAHVKKYAAEHGVPYKQAMKDAKATYKK